MFEELQHFIEVLYGMNLLLNLELPKNMEI